MMKWQSRRIGDFIHRIKDPVTVEDGIEYKQVTIRMNYKGVVLRGLKRGCDVKTKNQWRVRAGLFILSRIDARNGAFGIIPEELEGAIVSNDFLAYEIDQAEVDIEYFNSFLQSPIFLEACIKASRGNTNRKRVNENFFLDYQVELPTLSEQQRLITRINKAKDCIGIVDKEISHQETLLVKLKQAILQEAIQGRLTADWRKENSDVEPASQLLERIQKEKQRLIAEKKTRKEKPLPTITSEEISFEIPDSWAWCRLGEIAIHSLGKMLDKGKNKGKLMPYIRNLNVQWFDIQLHDLKQMRFEDHELEKYAVERGDIVICEGGYPGRAAIWERNESIMFQKALHRVRFISGAFDSRLFVYFLKLADEAGFLALYFTGAGIKHFTGKALHRFLIPLPPLPEQAAIVERTESLMDSCRQLETEIKHSRTHAENILQAVLKEAFTAKTV